MDPMGEEQVDYGEDEYGGSQKLQHQGSSGAIPALAEDDDDEFDDLYNDVNVGQGFMTHHNTLQQQQQQPPEPPPPSVTPFGNGGLSKHQPDGTIPVRPHHNVSGAGMEQNPSGYLPAKGLEEGSGDYMEGVSQKGNSGHVGDVGFQGGNMVPVPPRMLASDSGSGAIRGGLPVPPPNRATGIVGSRPIMTEDSRSAVISVESNGQTMLFVGDLQWWTTDAELESVLSEYGRVKEIKFFDERASGKSKGYCQVEFYDPAAAAACKENMNGYVFNGRACVVAFASAQAQRQMGAAYQSRNQNQAQSQPQGRRMNDGMGRGGGGGMNYQGGDGGRNYGRGGWGGRGGQGMVNRGQGGNGGGGGMRGRGFMGGKGMMGSGGGVGAGPYGQGIPGPGALGAPAGGMMHPQSMMGAGFDPSAFMGRGGPYGGFAAPAFPGMMPSFQAVNAVGLPGVAPHVNPAFFGRGMAANGMGIMGSSGMEGHAGGMWADPSMGGWTGEEHGRTRESSYGGDDVGSEYGYGEVNHERGGRTNAPREKERGTERDLSGNSERRHRDEKEQDWSRSDRERHREEKDGYRDHRPRDRDWDNEDDWDRGQSSSRSRSKSYMMQEDDHRSRSRDVDYGKRRRLPSE